MSMSADYQYKMDQLVSSLSQGDNLHTALTKANIDPTNNDLKGLDDFIHNYLSTNIPDSTVVDFLKDYAIKQLKQEDSSTLMQTITLAKALLPSGKGKIEPKVLERRIQSAGHAKAKQLLAAQIARETAKTLEEQGQKERVVPNVPTDAKEAIGSLEKEEKQRAFDKSVEEEIRQRQTPTPPTSSEEKRGGGG